MTRHEEIRTTDINLAASIMTATNRRPTHITAGLELVEFTFPADETAKAVTLEYAAGNLMQEVRRREVFTGHAGRWHRSPWRDHS